MTKAERQKEWEAMIAEYRIQRPSIAFLTRKNSLLTPTVKGYFSSRSEWRQVLLLNQSQTRPVRFSRYKHACDVGRFLSLANAAHCPIELVVYYSCPASD